MSRIIVLTLKDCDSVCLTEHWLASQSPSFLKIENNNIGDFTVDFIEDSGNRNQLLNLIESFGLHITTKEPSRLTKCIDNVITDISGDISKTVTEQLHFSDHRSQVFVCYKNQPENNHPNWIYRPSVTKTGIITLKKNFKLQLERKFER
ncbi:hypothetical protein HHI36_018530 [Cryptolaemus montrouzieri]|uniref:Uncharacterized protein n=1 Tax=Cryptolaemus montrouzieri TaxID=559131 RepID=A0ABD2P153_9CUCU